ncbi:MAG: flagellar motor protein MotD [Pseudomonadota bacterium]|nr:flagellar motor protein MotD [Pseudomonadota bacterium]
MRRRTAPDEDPETHERWLVSYADFVTLLFAVFVVMYAISTVNEGKYRIVSDALGHAFRRDGVAPPSVVLPMDHASPMTPLRTGQRSGEIARRQQEQKLVNLADRIAEALKPLVQSGQVRLTRSPRGLAVEINASVLFAPGQAMLQGSAISALQAVAEVIAPADNAVQVEGHTDNLPMSSMQYPSNWELSAARASSVVRLFAANGVESKRLTAIGYADNRPVQDNDSTRGRARNRRVTLLILAAGATEKDGMVTAAVPAPASMR